MELDETERKKIKNVMDNYMELAPGLKKHCDRCLKTRRWGESTVLMVIDAAFTSVGLNYFNVVVPRVMKFEEKYVESGEIEYLSDLSSLPHNKIKDLWKNKRSWNVARSVAGVLDEIGSDRGLDDRMALRIWASESSLRGWSENPVGSVKGVGLVTYQYLRMMGGVDTSMPDGIVRKVIKEILQESSVELPVKDDLDLVRTIEILSDITGYREVEITWMTWLVQSEGEKIRMDRYGEVLDRI